MPKFKFNLALFRSLLGPKIADEMEKFQDSYNGATAQMNQNPVGTMQTPPPLNSLTVTANASGFHSVAIDHSPDRPTVYHVEWSTTPDFQNPQPFMSNTPYRNDSKFMGNIAAYYRAYPSYVNGPPGPVTYFGSQAAPTLVQGAVGPITSINAPTPLPSTGSGAGTSLLPQGAQGFGQQGAQNGNSRDQIGRL